VSYIIIIGWSQFTNIILAIKSSDGPIKCLSQRKIQIINAEQLVST